MSEEASGWNVVFPLYIFSLCSLCFLLSGWSIVIICLRLLEALWWFLTYFGRVKVSVSYNRHFNQTTILTWAYTWDTGLLGFYPSIVLGLLLNVLLEEDTNNNFAGSLHRIYNRTSPTMKAKTWSERGVKCTQKQLYVSMALLRVSADPQVLSTVFCSKTPQFIYSCMRSKMYKTTLNFFVKPDGFVAQSSAVFLPTLPVL